MRKDDPHLRLWVHMYPGTPGKKSSYDTMQRVLLNIMYKSVVNTGLVEAPCRPDHHMRSTTAF